MIVTASALKQLVFNFFLSNCGYFSLFVVLFRFIFVFLWFLLIFVFSQKPLLASGFELQLLLFFLLFDFVLCLELFLPGYEVLYSNWSEGCEFGSFEYLLFGSQLDLVSLISSAFDQILVDPCSCLLHDIVHYGFLFTVADDLVYFAVYCVQIIASESSQWL